MAMETIEAFILAGGKSSRFGSDKTVFMFNGKPLIQHVIDSLQPLFSSTTIIANDTTKYNFIAIPVFPDIIPGLGPLGGIYTALTYAKTDFIFVCAADMPFLNREFIAYMLKIPHIYDCIVPCLQGYTEPLHAIYSKSCLPHIKKLIHEQKYKISHLFQNADVRYIMDDELIFYAENPSDLFYNINQRNDIPPNSSMQ